jgi:hypothetical protein
MRDIRRLGDEQGHQLERSRRGGQRGWRRRESIRVCDLTSTRPAATLSVHVSPNGQACDRLDTEILLPGDGRTCLAAGVVVSKKLSDAITRPETHESRCKPS